MNINIKFPKFHFVIYRDFLMFHHIFLSPQKKMRDYNFKKYYIKVASRVNQRRKISYLRKLGNIKKVSKLQRTIALCPDLLLNGKFW